MLIFYQPMYSRQELNSDSNYVLYTCFIRGMLKVRPDWHFVVVFPDANSGFKYQDDGFFNLPNVTRVAQRMSSRKRGNSVAYDPIYYDELYRRLGFDIVYANLVEMAGNLKYAGECGYGPQHRPVVVSSHHYVIHRSLPYPFDSMLNIALAQVSGGILADWNVFNSDYCRQMWTETAQEWASAKAIQEVMVRSTKIPQGVLDPDLEPHFDNNSIPVIIYNHRLQSYKNWRDTFDIFNRLYQEGLQFEVWYTSSSAENTAEIMPFPFVKVKLNATHKEYIECIKHGDFNVTNSSHETFCISAVESMALGQPIIAPNGVTFPEITNAEEFDYPYLFDNEAEQMMMMRKMIENASERKRWGKVLSKHVVSSYNHVVWAERHAELFEKLAKPLDVFGTRQTAKDVALKILQQKPKRTIKEWRLDLRDEIVDGRQTFGGTQAWTRTRLARFARSLGGHVTFEDGEQYIYAP